MVLHDKTLLSSYPSITSRLKTAATRYGIPLTEQQLLEVVHNKASQYEFVAQDLCDASIVRIMEGAGLFNSPAGGPYRLIRKKGGSWAILNENHKEILVGSQERILKAMEQHQAEINKRLEAQKTAEQAAKWAELTHTMAAIKGKDAWI